MSSTLIAELARISSAEFNDLISSQSDVEQYMNDVEDIMVAGAFTPVAGVIAANQTIKLGIDRIGIASDFLGGLVLDESLANFEKGEVDNQTTMVVDGHCVSIFHQNPAPGAEPTLGDIDRIARACTLELVVSGRPVKFGPLIKWLDYVSAQGHTNSLATGARRHQRMFFTGKNVHWEVTTRRNIAVSAATTPYIIGLRCPGAMLKHDEVFKRCN